MKGPFTISSVFFFVTGGALFGLILGGLFGWGAGNLAPDFFKHSLIFHEIEPVGASTVLGAFGGVVCGGLLAAFAIVVQLINDVTSRNK